LPTQAETILEVPKPSTYQSSKDSTKEGEPYATAQSITTLKRSEQRNYLTIKYLKTVQPGTKKHTTIVA
jgi:hypothetical protein